MALPTTPEGIKSMYEFEADVQKLIEHKDEMPDSDFSGALSAIYAKYFNS